jgi:hypothetical protein
VARVVHQGVKCAEQKYLNSAVQRKKILNVKEIVGKLKESFTSLVFLMLYFSKKTART